MKILLIANSADDVFITAKTKWLKKVIPNCIIDIFEFFPSDKQDHNIYADEIGSYNAQKGWFQKGMFKPFGMSLQLKNFLKGKYYDIIQCHWITRPVILIGNYHQYCSKLFATFWGGERSHLKLFHTKTCYNYFLDRFLRQVDYIINSSTYNKNLIADYPYMAGKCLVGALGSEPLEALYKLMEKESKAESKAHFGISPDKTVVLIGYSGKTLHQHLPIIQALSNTPELKNKIHLLAPMTRGGSEQYNQKVEQALKNSGYTYTQLTGGFLDNEEVARLRNCTDIVLQLSQFDGFSRSIVECFCAKAVVLYGEWMNYLPHLQENGFKAHPVQSIEEAVERLIYIVDNLTSYKEECEQNSVNGKKNNLWSECICGWKDAYESALSY